MTRNKYIMKKNRTILVVDDSLTIRMFLSNMLHEYGFSVNLAENGKACFSELQKAKPDLILLDLVLPDISGIEICKKIKKDKDFREIPILILTSESDISLKIEGLGAGAEDYVMKPFEKEELLARLQVLFRNKDLEKELREKNKEILQAQKEIEQKATALEIASKHKSEFLANMSHELRTPLNSILILSQILAENPDNLSAKQLKFAETINSAGKDLLALINEILDLAKIEAGKIELKMREVDLFSIAKNIQDLFAQTAKNKGIQFSIALEEVVPIFTDFQRLYQILKNLISNAFKFTEKGKVSFTIKALKDHIKFCVQDTGIGIPPDKQQVVFQEFKQADGTISRKYGGTGLGLSISKKLSELLGGKIELESEEGKGSKFCLILPIHNKKIVKKEVCKKDITRQKKEKPKKEVEFYHGKVLIVDDDIRNVFALTSILEKSGLHVMIAKNGKEGLRTLRSHEKIDLIFMDIMMSEMDGYEATKIIKNDRILRHIPIIAVTAKAMESDKEKCLSAGADSYLVKPIDIKKLSFLLEKYLQKRDSLE